MKTDNNKIFVTTAVTATALLLAFQSVSAFNPQPEPPALTPSVAPEDVKAKNPASPPPPDRKLRAIEPGNDKPHAMDPSDDGGGIKLRTMEPLDKK
jgi:hypothetical protein